MPVSSIGEMSFYIGPGELICTPAGGIVGVRVGLGVRVGRGVEVALKLGVGVADAVGLGVVVWSLATEVGLS